MVSPGNALRKWRMLRMHLGLLKSEGCPAWTRPDELGIGRAIAACVAGGAWVGDPSCDGTPGSPPWKNGARWGGYQPAGTPNMTNGKSLMNGGLSYFGFLN